MSRGPTPTTPPKNEGEYARKLALAILSTLETKGILTRFDVDTILHAAHRAASQPDPAPAKTPSAAPKPTLSVIDRAPTVVSQASGPAALGTQWVKKDADTKQEPAAQASEATRPVQPPPGVIIIPSPDETEQIHESSVKIISKPREPKPADAKKDSQPVVIDFNLE